MGQRLMSGGSKSKVKLRTYTANPEKPGPNLLPNIYIFLNAEAPHNRSEGLDEVNRSSNLSALI